MSNKYMEREKVDNELCYQLEIIYIIYTDYVIHIDKIKNVKFIKVKNKLKCVCIVIVSWEYIFSLIF